LKLLKLHSILLLLIFVVSCADDETSTKNLPPEEQMFQGEFEFAKTFGGSQDEEAISVTKTNDGGFAVLGFTQSTDGDVVGKTATDSDYWLLKFDGQANLLWSKVYGGTGDDRGQKIIITNDGGFAVIGYSRSDDGDVTDAQGFYDYWMLKLNSSGDLQWQKSFGFPGSDRGYAIVQTTDGGYFLSGYLDVTASEGQGNDRSAGVLHGVGEFWGVKLDAEGNKEWRRYFGGTNNDRSYDAIQAEDGGFIMVGNSESDDFDITDPRGSYDFWVVKTNAEGDLQWQKNFGGSSIDIAYGITKTLDGNYVVTGDIRSNDGDVSQIHGNADVWVIKIDDLGNLLWKQNLGGTNFDSSNKVLQLENEDLLITGSSRSNDIDLNENYGDSDGWLMMIDKNGNLQWQQSIGGSDFDVLSESIQLDDKSIISVGNTESTDGLVEENKGNKDILIVKIR